MMRQRVLQQVLLPAGEVQLICRQMCLQMQQEEQQRLRSLNQQRMLQRCLCAADLPTQKLTLALLQSQECQQAAGQRITMMMMRSVLLQTQQQQQWQQQRKAASPQAPFGEQ
jgi:hypothetical protein